MSNAAVVLYRSLLRTARRCRQAPAHHDITAGVRSGVVRANEASHVGGLLQVEARSGDLETGIRTAFSAEERRKNGDAHFNEGFLLLRRLAELDASLGELGASGAFSAVDWRPDHVKFGVGQPLSHEDWGLCVVYGWEERCAATTPDAGDGALDGIVDNRVHFSGIDEEDEWEVEDDEEGEQEQQEQRTHSIAAAEQEERNAAAQAGRDAARVANEKQAALRARNDALSAKLQRARAEEQAKALGTSRGAEAAKQELDAPCARAQKAERTTAAAADAQQLVAAEARAAPAGGQAEAQAAAAAAAAADDAAAEEAAGAAFLEQPFYRVLLADGSARFVAQERLRPVGRDEGLKRVIQGTSFFFTGTEKNAGWYIANPHLAARFPDDAAAIRAAGRGSQLGFKLTACATDI